MVELDKFQGHIVLYCKGQYGPREGMDTSQFFEGLKRIWAIRCGYDYEYTSSDVLSFIADDMYKIIIDCLPQRLEHIMSQMHRQLCNKSFYIPDNLNTIESVVWYYRSVLSNMQIRDTNKETNELIDLIKLPAKLPDIFNRIIAGDGEYKDYWLINPKED